MRVAPSLREEVETVARMFRMDATTFARECLITGLRLKQIDMFSLSDRRLTG